MKAAIFRAHGGSDVLEYADVPAPSPGPGQALIRVKACSLNHLDLWVRQGVPAYQISLPHISGCDVAGIVEALGPGVNGLTPGDRVFVAPGISCFACEPCRAGHDNQCATYGIVGAKTDGGYAELTLARASDVLPIPDGLSFEAAAAFPLVFLTAWHMLMTRAGLRSGETVLVRAGGSGVGHAAIQIAKLANATVYATVGSAAKAAKARALGVDEVLVHSNNDVLERVQELTHRRGVDVVVEHIGPATWETSLKALAKNGRLVTCGATTGPTVPLDLRYVFSRQLTILGSMMGTRAELLEVTRLVGQERLRPVIDTVFPLKEARAAQERLASRDVFGKLLLIPS